MSGTYLLVQIVGSTALLPWGIRMARTSVMRTYGANIFILALFTPFLGRLSRLFGLLFPDELAQQTPAFGPHCIVPLGGSYSSALPLSALTRETPRMSDVVASDVIIAVREERELAAAATGKMNRIGHEAQKKRRQA